MNTTKNTNAPAITFITKDTQIKADIHCKDDLRIAGFVKGKTESKQRIMIAETEKIKGVVISTIADISGKIIGDVRVSNKLTLRSTAIVEGKILAKKLIIEDGAQIKGFMQVGPDTDTSEKQSKNTAKPEAEDNKEGSNADDKSKKDTHEETAEDQSKSSSPDH